MLFYIYLGQRLVFQLNKLVLLLYVEVVIHCVSAS